MGRERWKEWERECAIIILYHVYIMIATNHVLKYMFLTQLFVLLYVE